MAELEAILAVKEQALVAQAQTAQEAEAALQQQRVAASQVGAWVCGLGVHLCKCAAAAVMRTELAL